LVDEVAVQIYNAGIEASTQSSYNTHVFGEPSGYCTVLKRLGYENPWPATVSLIAKWLAYHRIFQLPAATSAKYLTGLKAYHVANNMPWAVGVHDLKKLSLLKAGSLRLDVKQKQRRMAVKPVVFAILPFHLLLFAENRYLRQSYHGALFLFSSSVATYASNRSSEVFDDPKDGPRCKVLLLSSLTFENDGPVGLGLNLNLSMTKTQPETPTDLWLPSLPANATCPVRLGRRYLEMRSLAGLTMEPSSPLFLLEGGGSLRRKHMLQFTRSALHRVGLHVPPNEFISAKSWRSGGAQAVDRLPPGSIDRQTKLQGRWKSIAFKAYLSQQTCARVFALAFDAAHQGDVWKSSRTEQSRRDSVAAVVKDHLDHPTKLPFLEPRGLFEPFYPSSHPGDVEVVIVRSL
jgi:hypothetical protein